MNVFTIYLTYDITKFMTFLFLVIFFFLLIDDPFTALSLFLTVASSPDIPMSSSEVNEMLEAGAKATDAKGDRYINAGQLSLIYSAMLPLAKNENNKNKRKALEVIRRGTNLIFAHKVCSIIEFSNL